MSAIAKSLAASSTSLNPTASIPVEMVVAWSDNSVPAIANYGPIYQIAYTLSDKTIINIRYATAVLKNAAVTAYRAAFSTNF